jgi:uncharacterized protein YegL
MSILKKTELSRRKCPVIFMLDTSGSMGGQPIGAVNAAIEGVLPELISMNEDNPDVQIEIAIMTFDTVVKWITGNSLVDPEKYAWNDLNVSGITNMGAAFTELSNKLSVSQGFMASASGSVAPVLFLLSDGEPSDEYKSGLQKLQDNNWYKVAVRVAIGYGDSNDAVLIEFTKNPETVLHTNDPKDLQALIKFITVTSSMVASKGGGSSTSSSSGSGATGANAQPDNDMTNALAGTLQTSPPVLDPADDVW